MLRQYGPDVPENILEKLVLSFGELREMADQGLIAYPYSTREVVNMVKHLQVCVIYDLFSHFEICIEYYYYYYTPKNEVWEGI
jgi:hypothetical protein